jgi:NAD(P)-dependent dehydrogenase (short-subunit alcohol dehydrogenase family)
MIDKFGLTVELDLEQTTQVPYQKARKGLVDGLRVLVTGAGSGIGAATVNLFAESGAQVFATDINEADAASVVISLPEFKAHCSSMMDVSNAESVRTAFDYADKVFGGVDAVVHCAGIWRPSDDGPLPKVTDAVWNQIIAVNLTGTFNVCREAVLRMEKMGGGSIVTVASAAAITGWEKLNAYSASKGGVLSFSRALAIESGPSNIRVNCICPGVIETPMTQKVLAYSQPGLIPLRRIGQAIDVAGVALFLCSSLARHVTAATIPVDGGSSAA